MNVLVVGGGGREHAVCWKLKQSPLVDKLYCAPGNAGIAEIAECVDIKATDIDGIVKFVDEHKDIAFTVVAPDDPLAMGLVDKLEAAGVYGSIRIPVIVPEKFTLLLRINTTSTVSPSPLPVVSYFAVIHLSELYEVEAFVVKKSAALCDTTCALYLTPTRMTLYLLALKDTSWITAMSEPEGVTVSNPALSALEVPCCVFQPSSSPRTANSHWFSTLVARVLYSSSVAA